MSQSTSRDTAAGIDGLILLLGILVFFGAAGVPFVSGLFGEWGSAMPFVLTLIAYVVGALCVVWAMASWSRSSKNSRAGGFALVGVGVASSVCAFIVMRMIAYSAGILGSAIPRLLQGIPTSTDLTYLGACVVIALAVLLALVLLVRLFIRR